LLPVTELDRGFVRPEYPAQVIVSYYQAGQVCDYIQDRWGAQKLLEMVRSFAKRETTSDVIRQDLSLTPEDFDRQFLEWLNNEVGKEAANFDQWRKGLRDMAELAKNHQYDEVHQKAEEVRRLYPDYVYDANVYQFLAEAYLAKEDKQAATTVLTEYQKFGGRDPATLKELASLEEALGNPQEAAATLDRINYIYPHDEQLHRHLGDLWFEQGNYSGAIREYTSAVAMQPADKASAEFNLARAYFAAGQTEKAEQNVLQALEAAPDYRPAQKLLLQLQASTKGK